MFKRLFTPATIGAMEVPNRLVVPAMVSNMCTSDGCVTERYIAYHEAKAKGGWGLIITEDYAVDPNGKGYRFIGGLWNDQQIAGQRQFTDRIHPYGSKVVAQIYHAGRQTKRAVLGGVQPVAPSAIPCPWCRDLPRELTLPEIRKIVSQFGDAARRARQAGFDGVELHGANGYLLSEFMSPYSNKRTDEYGGCLQKRMRFAREIITDVRAKVGPGFPVLFRISVDEFQPGSRDIAETRVIARLLEDWGIDAIHLSSGVYGNPTTVSPMVIPHAWLADLSAEVKRLVHVPVIMVNRINDPMMADVLLDMGKADFVAMGRGSIADPELPHKARAGEFERIRYCLGCVQSCIGNLSGAKADGPIACAVNPTLGYEYETSLAKAALPKKVLVIGGGPAGMEAARAAALKGHTVHLYERRDFLGGQFKSAAYAPFKGDLAAFTAWQISELKRSANVTVHLNRELTPDLAKAEKPDVIIIATGATPIIPNIPGVERPNVVSAEDVLLGAVPTGNNCFVAGGGSVGVETAAHLALQIKHVTVADMLPELAPEERRDIKLAFLRLLRDHGVEQITSAKIVEITASGVLLEKDGQTTLHPCDTVILALGYQRNDALAAALHGLAEKVVIAGDALGPARLTQATRSGWLAGLNA